MNEQTPIVLVHCHKISPYLSAGELDKRPARTKDLNATKELAVSSCSSRFTIIVIIVGSILSVLTIPSDMIALRGHMALDDEDKHTANDDGVGEGPSPVSSGG